MNNQDISRIKNGKKFLKVLGGQQYCLDDQSRYCRMDKK